MMRWIGPKTLIISIMAGIRLKQMQLALETERVLRAMPNTPGAIGRGVSVISAADDMPKKDIKTAISLLSPLGDVLGPVPEAQISAVTGVSGSGPAYVFLLVEALAGAGEAEGLPEELALRLARETVIGAAALLEETGAPPEDLRKAVTSKNGTTEAALDILMRGDGMPSLMREAVRAAATRERALSAGK
jgi:pyrroline-5-carboxylate reductase